MAARQVTITTAAGSNAPHPVFLVGTGVLDGPSDGDPVPIVGGGFPALFTGAMSRHRNDPPPTSVPTVGACCRAQRILNRNDCLWQSDPDSITHRPFKPSPAPMPPLVPPGSHPANAACGRPGRGSGCPPDSHSLPRLRFAYPCVKGGAPQGRRDCLPHRFYEHGYMILRLQSPRNRIDDSISTPFAQGGLGAVQASTFPKGPWCGASRRGVGRETRPLRK